jgi:uncharacterized membrane protein
MSLFVLSVATGLIGLIIVFPVLGHATWHAFSAMRGAAPERAYPGEEERATRAPS